MSEHSLKRPIKSRSTATSSLLLRILKRRYVYLALAPALLLLAVFEWYPALSAFYNSFFLWNGGKLHTFVGWENYRYLLQDRAFMASLRNLAIFLLFRIVFQALLPFIAAELIINLKSERWANWWKIIFVFPMVVPNILMYLIWRFVYNPQVGILNKTLELFGLGELTRAWLADPVTALWALSFVRFPWLPTLQFLIILGGLQAIPKEVIESAKLDGANWLARIRYIDLPMVRGQLLLAMLLTAIFLTQRFDLFLILTDGGPGYSTMVPALHLYQSAFNFLEFGYASAIGVFMFVIMLALTVLNMRLRGKEV
jgi:ABC-type sugar transport system permease subunit